jgi:tRNA isopentenyl-2-thiomethyl-A-37 hydroxylase MiaE
LYLRLAERHAQEAGLAERRAEAGALIATRLAELAVIEAEAATSPDTEFRFHSGDPTVGEPVLRESDLAPREP